MITTTLCGGLGNQMFIYAMVRAMSLRNNVPMAFNTRRGFERDFLYRRTLELDKFKLSLPEATLATFNMPGGLITEKVSRHIGWNVLLPKYKCINEDIPNYHFQKELVTSHFKNAYITGYWQSPSYFEDFADIIRKDFTIGVDLPKETKEELEYLLSQNRPLVFVGVRRYQEAEGKNCRLSACGADYYNKAMQRMAQTLDNPLFVIFGEVREWAEENLSPDFDKYFILKKSGELSTISDLYLMQNCHHAIISNSTYYWWGAWLQKPSANHFVIAPSNFINPDTVCKDWEIL